MDTEKILHNYKWICDETRIENVKKGDTLSLIPTTVYL